MNTASQPAQMNTAGVAVDAAHGAQPASQSTARSRLAYIERAKGLAIFLVVLGHLSREAPPGHDWYLTLKDMLYQFHMPFFMCLSGFTMFLSYRPVDGARDYARYVNGKFQRLMPSFLLFGLLILLGKEIAAHFMPVDNMHASLLGGALQILTKPITSPAGFLWYIYTLFLFHAAMPLLMRVQARHLAWLLPPALALHFWPMDKELADWFMFSQFSEYLVFVVIGFFIARDREYWLEQLTRRGGWFIAIFALLLGAYVAVGGGHPYSKTVLGMASIPALLALVSLRGAAFGGWLGLLGGYCFTIYLLNLPVMGTLKGMAAATPVWDGGWFPLIALIMLTGGLLLPIFISRHLLQKSRWLDRITR